MDFPSVPPNFKPLQQAYAVGQGVPLNVIGVCTDFKDVMQTRGSDMTISFVLHDPSWLEGLGLSVRFFHKAGDRLPKITSTGDIVVLRNVKNTDFRGERVSFSNSASSWVVLEYESLRNSTCDRGTDIVVHRSGQHTNLAPHPSILELKYAKYILGLEDPGSWRIPLKIHRTMDDVPSAQGITVKAGSTSKEKFTLVSDAALTYGMKGIFRDLFCEVRRMWESPNGDRCELFVTDYTENANLYDYRHGEPDEGMGYDHGDRFGYVNGTYKAWPGPWGKMTILVNCWRPHCSFAMKNVQPGDFVYLWNVQITYDRDGTKLEGHCRTDQFNPDKVNVQLIKKTEAETDEKFKSLLRRKRAYEELCKKSNMRFIRDAKTIRAHGQTHTEDKEDEPPVSKNAKKKHKKKAKAGAAAAIADAGTSDIQHQLLSKTLTPNANIRCNNIDIPLTTISNIMDAAMLLRKTSSGHLFYTPFQNTCYKSKVRVVDFFPDDLASFCAPIRDSGYAGLSDHESVSDIDSTQSPIDEDDEDVKWEWRFILLVEDAKPSSTSSETTERMGLVVCGQDGDYLLRESACNLSNNPKKLAKLKETLFHLWGDLQEQKEECKASEDYENLKPNGRPFECFIKEYGVPSEEDTGRTDEDVKVWERMHRICYTTISVDNAVHE